MTIRFLNIDEPGSPPPRELDIQQQRSPGVGDTFFDDLYSTWMRVVEVRDDGVVMAEVAEPNR